MNTIRMVFAAGGFLLASAFSASAESPDTQPPPKDLPVPATAETSRQQAPVTDCDRYATTPFYPERKAPALHPLSIDAAKAIPACEAAVRDYPQERRLRFQLAITLNRADPSRSAAILRDLANDGDATAMAFIGDLYIKGRGVPEDKAKGLRLLRKAADAGNWVGLWALAGHYIQRGGNAEAGPLILQLEKLNNADAWASAGSLYIGIKNPRKAAELMILALKKRSEFATVFAVKDRDIPGGEYYEELKRLLALEGVYRGPIDGTDNTGLQEAVQALAGKGKSG